MNRRIKNLLARVKNEDGGFALPFIASMMILLLGISAFAIDLGWIYLNGGRLQRGADSAALAGVVYLPHDTAQVQSKAIAGANANGWSIGTVVPDGGASQNVGSGSDSMAWNQLEDNKLRVQLTTSVDTFFLKVLGFDQFTLRRTATAQFIKPVPLGAPANCIGIGPGVQTAGLPSPTGTPWSTCGTYTQNFWSAINGRRTAIEHGDPYATNCNWQCGSTSGNSANFDPNYYFAVDVPANAGTWVDVYVYDAGFYARSGFAETGDSELGDSNPGGGTNMQFQIFAPDSSPQIPENNLTQVGTCNLSINSGADSATYRNRWVRICRINNPGEGLYILRAANGGNIGGTNQYSFIAYSSNFAATAARMTRVYSLNEMGIFTNSASGNATVYIADVAPVHANKILELTFYDPGETAGTGTMSVVPPAGVTGYTCTWTATDNHPPVAATSGTGCSINTSSGGNSQYNAEWITMQIHLPSNYTCNPAGGSPAFTGCFWKMNLALQTAHDRTTWEARVIGNPVALVPNEP